MRPFKVYYHQTWGWVLEKQGPSWGMVAAAPKRYVNFLSPGAAIDFAYKHWPWWP